MVCKYEKIYKMLGINSGLIKILKWLSVKVVKKIFNRLYATRNFVFPPSTHTSYI